MVSVLLLMPAQAYAQLYEVGQHLGIEIVPRGVYDYTADAYYAEVMYSRIASSQQIDPTSKGIGLVRTVFLAAGARTQDLSTFDFRWRAGLIDMDFIRTPLSMGLTLIDYNKSGLLELDVRWINIRLGPSIHLGSPTTYFTLKAVGTGGVTTLKMGSFAYAGLEADAELAARKRSYEIGYIGEAVVMIADRVSLSGLFEYRHLLGGLRPERYQLTGQLGVRISENISIQGIYALEDMRLARSSMDRQLFGGLMSLKF